MKRLLTAIVGLALAQSVLASGDVEQKTLFCEETSPLFGQSYVISISGDQVDRFVLRYPGVASAPNPVSSWSAHQGEFTASFSKAIESAGGAITVTEQVDETDWNKTDSCFAIVRKAHLFVSSNSQAGPYSGQVTFGGFLDRDPSVPDSECFYPHMTPAPHINISCQLL